MILVMSHNQCALKSDLRYKSEDVIRGRAAQNLARKYQNKKAGYGAGTSCLEGPVEQKQVVNAKSYFTYCHCKLDPHTGKMDGWMNE